MNKTFFANLLEVGRDRERWLELLSVYPDLDAYYHPDYLGLSRAVHGNEPYLFVAGDSDGNCILYPFVRRQLQSLPFAVSPGLSDIITPEYGGPVYCGNASAREAVITHYRHQFEELCRELSVVAEFCRVNPFMPSALPPEALVYNRELVAVPLQGQGDPLTSYRKGTRSAVKKAARLDVVIAPLQPALDADWDEMYAIYIDTMCRNQAKDDYFYPRSFFSYLQSVSDVVTGFKAVFEGRTIAASLFLTHGSTVHYYLSGTLSDYLYTCSNALLLDHAIRHFAADGKQCLNLGGGYQPGNNLFLFKSGFSEGRAPFTLYRQVHNRDVYRALCAARDAAASGSPSDAFFPYYRLPL